MASTRRGFLGATGTTAVLALAGCTTGGGGGNATTTQTTTAETTTTMDGTTTMGESSSVQVFEHESLGEILVGPQEMTLYMFEADTQGEEMSTCYDSCAGAWPPLVAEDPTKASGVTASISTFAREDGSQQVAANGWPLYYFVNDSEPGDANGQGVNGFGGYWWVLAPDGTPMRTENTTTAETTTETTTSNGGGGGGYGGDY